MEFIDHAEMGNLLATSLMRLFVTVGQHDVVLSCQQPLSVVLVYHVENAW